MQHLKIKKDDPKSKKWLTSCELDTKPNRSLETWVKKGKFNSSAKNQNVQLQNREILNCTNWERFPRAFIAKRAYNTHQKDYFRCMHNALAGTEKKD